MAELLQDWLRRQFPQASQTTLRRMLQDGRVRVNDAVARQMKRPISPSDQVEIASRPKLPSQSPERLIQPLKIIYQDADVLVVDKPPGLLTSTVPRERRPTALAIVRAYLKLVEPASRPGLIHRLDRDASGLLVFSKTEAAYRSLKQQFFKHAVLRVYAAVTHGTPTPLRGIIESRLVELPDGSVKTSVKPGAGERAVTEYETVLRQSKLAAVRVTLQTGRKHQIRVHLSERGVPIVGDRVYGQNNDAANRLMLAAVRIGFEHPTSGKALSFEINVPKTFELVGGKKMSNIKAD